MSNTLCRWVSSKLSKPPTEYLLAHEKQIIEEHLNECVHCSEMRDVAAAMNQWTALEPPSASPFVERKIIADALDGRMPQNFRERLWKGGYAPLIAAGTIAIAIISTILVYLSPVSSESGKSERRQSASVLEPVTPKKYNLVHFEKATPIRLMREDKVWGSEAAIVDLQVLSNKLTRIELIQGKIVAQVTKRAHGDRFEVVGPSGTVIVVGTVFSVEVNDAGVEHIRVLEGTVKVQDRRTGTVTSVAHHREFTIGSSETAVASEAELS
ncbi:MAG: FecR domain-containing protein, partial [Deltaproteobacteria bacterium]|nr:FecR domain-containing protein [Deltaproteobacteria bacterium]